MLRDRRILHHRRRPRLGRAFAEPCDRVPGRVAVADILEMRTGRRGRNRGGVFVPLDLASPAPIQACVAPRVRSLGGLELVNNGASPLGRRPRGARL